MKKKKFDCVKMKDDIQKKMLKDEKKIGKEAYREKMNEWLEKSNDGLAVFWRKVSEQHSTYN